MDYDENQSLAAATDNTMALLIQYHAHYGMQIPLCEYIVSIHRLFHGCKHSISTRLI